LPGAHAIIRRRSCCGRKLRLRVALLRIGCNQASKLVSEKRREERKLEEEEQRREKAGAHRNRRWKPSVSASFDSEIRRPGGISDAEKKER
jgi:hypothetical protein